MGRRAVSTRAVALVAALALAVVAFQACGGGEHERDRKRCEVCAPEVNGHCFDECIEFCPGGEDCTARCEAQCDQCKRDLRCVACSADCSGEEFRCSAPGDVLICEDGQF